MRVAHIGIKGLPARGGAERVVEGIVSKVSDYGVQPVVYCDQAYTPVGTKIGDVELLRMPSIGGKHIRQSILNLVCACHAVFCGRYDVIHLHHVEAAFVLPILRLRYRVVATSHGSAYKCSKWSGPVKSFMRAMEWPFMRMSSIPTNVSKVGADDLSARFGRKVTYIPNGVSSDFPPDFAAAQDIIDSHGLEKGKYLIFVAGRIEPIKGAHLAIKAVNHLTNCKLLMVGDDAQVPEYQKQIREMVGPNVHFHPPVRDPHTLYGLMASSAGLIFPSLVEAMSMVLLEAASLGVPILASDIPENTAVMENDALYFQSGRASSLEEKLRWAQAHPDEFADYARRAEVRVNEQFSWSRIAERYARLYSDAIAGRREAV